MHIYVCMFSRICSVHLTLLFLTCIYLCMWIGMVCAGITCPIDVCKFDLFSFSATLFQIFSGLFITFITCAGIGKTRIISRDKENVQKMKAWEEEVKFIQEQITTAQSSLTVPYIYPLSHIPHESGSETELEGEEVFGIDDRIEDVVLSTTTTTATTTSDSSPLSSLYSIPPPSSPISCVALLDYPTEVKAVTVKAEQKAETLAHPSFATLTALNATLSTHPLPPPPELNTNANVIPELIKIFKEEGWQTLFLGLKQRLIYTGLANGIRLAAYGTSRMDLMMRSFDDL